MAKKYLVYRTYTKKERPGLSDRSRFYGWSSNKSVVKAFLEQRNPKKYTVIKMSKDRIAETFSEEIDDVDAMIDMLKLKSVSTGEEIPLFMTLNEMRETEKKIQRMFDDTASLERIDGTGNYLQMFLNFDEYYADALFLIGCRPREIDIMFPSADYHDDYSSIMKVEEEIDNAYDRIYTSPSETYTSHYNKILGLSTLEDVCNKIYYSIESFVKVLKDDM